MTSAAALRSVSQDTGIDDDIPIPTVRRGFAQGFANATRKAAYRFEDLVKVGQSFHHADGSLKSKAGVALTHKELVIRLSAACSAENERHSFDIAGKTRDKVGRELARHTDGSPVLDAEGKKIWNQVSSIVPEKGYRKRFEVRSVGADDPRGAGVRVFRVV